MTQPSPTPLPDHGTGWGLLLLFVNLYGLVALLGFGTVVAIALDRFDRRVPRTLVYLVVGVLLVTVGLAAFVVVVAATSGRYDVVALVLGVVFLPLAVAVLGRRGNGRRRLAVLARAAMVWSLPFLVGFGVVAFVDAQSSGIPRAVTGTVAVIVAVAGTMGVERLSVVPDVERPRGDVARTGSEHE